MKYPFILQTIGSGHVEVRFPDLVGARAVFNSERTGASQAIAVLVEYIRERQRNRRRVPIPTSADTQLPHVCLPDDIVEAIIRHNQMLEQSGELQDLA